MVIDMPRLTLTCDQVIQLNDIVSDYSMRSTKYEGLKKLVNEQAQGCIRITKNNL